MAFVEEEEYDIGFVITSGDEYDIESARDINEVDDLDWKEFNKAVITYEKNMIHILKKYFGFVRDEGHTDNGLTIHVVATKKELEKFFKSFNYSNMATDTWSDFAILREIYSNRDLFKGIKDMTSQGVLESFGTLEVYYSGYPDVEDMIK